MTSKIIMLIACFALAGCDEHHSNDKIPIALPVCRHDAVYAAITVSEIYPVRIARGHNSGGGGHAQAQYKMDGEWRFLRLNKYGMPIESEQDKFTVDGFYSVDMYFDHIFAEREKHSG